MKIKLPRDWKKSEKRYLTSAQIAYICGLSPSTIFRAAKEGTLKSVRTPGGHLRVERSDAIDFIEKMGITPGQKVLDLIASL
jgi:excisionase family DNA binding protein